MLSTPVFLTGALIAASTTPLDEPSAQAVELGRIHWQRDHDKAFVAARSAERPLLTLFQEIPG